MSYEKDLSNFRVIESSLQDIFSNLESVTTEDLVKSLDSLVEFVEDYKVKLQTREKIESYLLDFDKYPTEAFTEILKVLEKFETPEFPVVEILGKFYETVPERFVCGGCAFDKKMVCFRPNGYLSGRCTSEKIIYREVSTDD